jgi:hypothetical protein
MIKKIHELDLIYDDPQEWDEDWATDWDHLVEIASQIESLKRTIP